MSIGPLFVSFHTNDPGYTAEARGLAITLDAHNLEYEILSVPPFDSWVRACSYKAAFMQGMRKKHAARALVWLDSDARVLQSPARLLTMPTEVDFAAHWLRDTELLGGTLYFGATAAADQVIDAWATVCAALPEVWDQRVLQKVIEAAAGLRIECLPASYVWIQGENAAPHADISGRIYGLQEPIIRHRQASRRVK